MSISLVISHYHIVLNKVARRLFILGKNTSSQRKLRNKISRKYVFTKKMHVYKSLCNKAEQYILYLNNFPN